MNIKDLITKADADYPEISGVRGSEKDIEYLSKAYSSCLSETTAVLQYLFQHHIVKDREVANILQKIAINEMHHHDILAEVIVSLGGVPYYTNGFGGDYTTKCVYEGKDLLDMFSQNVKDEQGTVEYYEQIKDKLSNPRLREIIDRIILDELVHIETFNKLIEYVTYYKD